MQPLILSLPALTAPAPSVDPLLLLLVPFTLLLVLVADTLGLGEPLPLGQGLGDRQRLFTGEKGL
jgi:hypothetical protein